MKKQMLAVLTAAALSLSMTRVPERIPRLPVSRRHRKTTQPHRGAVQSPAPQGREPERPRPKSREKIIR